MQLKGKNSLKVRGLICSGQSYPDCCHYKLRQDIFKRIKTKETAESHFATVIQGWLKVGVGAFLPPKAAFAQIAQKEKQQVARVQSNCTFPHPTPPLPWTQPLWQM